MATGSPRNLVEIVDDLLVPENVSTVTTHPPCSSILSQLVLLNTNIYGWCVNVNVLLRPFHFPHQKVSAIACLACSHHNFEEIAGLVCLRRGAIAAILMELSCLQSFLYAEEISNNIRKRAANVLFLFSCLARFRPIRHLFLSAQFISYIAPYTNTLSKLPAFETLRGGALRIFAHMIKHPDRELCYHFIHNNVVQSCCRVMLVGGEGSGTLATFIVRQLLGEPWILSYVCRTRDILDPLLSALTAIVDWRNEALSSRLLKQVVTCFYQLNSDECGKQKLIGNMPLAFQVGTWDHLLTDDPGTMVLMKDLVAYLDVNFEAEAPHQPQSNPRFPHWFF